MTFTDSIKSCLNKYATFRGRAPRSEYWWFWLFCVLVYITLTLAFGLIGYLCGNEKGMLVAIRIGVVVYYLMLFLPILSVMVRRLHDVGSSGWESFVCVGSLILSVLEETGYNLAKNLDSWSWLTIVIVSIIVFGFLLRLLVLLLKDSDEENQYGLPVY